MIQNASGKFVYAITLLIFMACSGRAIAQSSSTPSSNTNSNPSVVTGTDPEPQYSMMYEILSLLYFE